MLYVFEATILIAAVLFTLVGLDLLTGISSIIGAKIEDLIDRWEDRRG